MLMEERNLTAVTEFILLGLTDDPVMQVPLFLLFFLLYIITIVCNIGISTLIVTASQLHTPMYFFLFNLSISDFCYSSIIVPKMLNDLFSKKKSISFTACGVQMHFLVMFSACGAYMLSAMAYDRYAAVCHPLLYPVIMNRTMCIQLVSVVYLTGKLTALSITLCTFNSSFCSSNIIDHFYCDAPPVMDICCSNMLFRKLVLLSVCLGPGLGSLLITVTSYVYIISAILRIPSTSGRIKTFSTCGSHLTVLLLFYVTVLMSYFGLLGNGSAMQKKVASVCYIVLSSVVNPLIYSLRNQDIKRAMHYVIHKSLKNIQLTSVK